MGQGIARLVSGAPLTTGDMIAPLAAFTALTPVAGGLRLRMHLAMPGVPLDG